MPSAHELAALIVNRQRELDKVMRADLRRLQDKYGDLLLTAAIKIADRELASPEPRRQQAKPHALDEDELLQAVEQASGVRS
jgi:hypothetical protein